MTLPAGTRLGTYEVLSPLGAGGMGEVYRALDPRLGREVAVKLLPQAVASDPEHLARLEREARALAALNHPNIAAIHGIEETDGVRFLVLELVPGDTLTERLTAGPLPLEEALDACRQVAEALEAAHEKGIIHRDLKPGNIKITPNGRVKVLDLGLAKSLPPTSASVSASPTVTAGETQEGTVLGTPAYMSPEQARGKVLDKRTDIWSFGCVLYEALTGHKAFGGETASDAIAAILTGEPDWSRLPRGTPVAIRGLLGRCLEKDPSRRVRDAGDARLEIEAALASRRRPGAGARRDRRALWATPVAVALALLFVAYVTLRLRGASDHARSAPKLSQVTFAEGIEQFPAFSPDGSEIAYSGEAGGVRKIFIKRLATGEDRRVTSGDSDDIQPAWSPDGRTILFARSRQPQRKLEPGDVFGQYVGGDVWALDVVSGREARLLENAFNPSYSPDGKRVAVDAAWVGPSRIWLVDERGLNRQQVTSDVSEAVHHVRPRWSPDGARIVFQNIEWTKFDVRVVDTGSKKLLWVTNDLFLDVNPVWSASGRDILFSSYRSGGLNIWRIRVEPGGAPAGRPEQLTTGAGQDIEIAASPGGRRLAFSILKQNADLWRLPVLPQTGAPTGPPQEVIATTREDSRGAWSPDGQRIAFNSDRSGEMNIWISSLTDGSVRALTKGPGGDYQPQWSPDGRRVVFFSARAGNADIWSADVTTGELTQLTRDRAMDVNPVFSPDGTRIAYQSDASGRLEVWVRSADGSQPRQLTRIGVTGHFLRWTGEGTAVVFRCPCGGKPETMRAQADGGEPEPLGETAGGSHISFSPDGSRIMDVVAHKALWVSPLGAGSPEKLFEFEDATVRIDYPVWSPDGRWILFDRFRPQGGDIWAMEGFE